MANEIKTIEVAAQAQVSVNLILSGVRNGRLRPPKRRDASGHYWWTEDEVAAIKAALSIDRRRKEFRQAQPAAASPV